MINFIKTDAKNQIVNKLVSDNCLSFGRKPKLNNRKINHYIFGTRQQVNIFKLHEIRYLLLKTYPLIHNLFFQERLNSKLKKKWFFEKNYNFKTKDLPEPFQNLQDFRQLKNKYSYILRAKKKKLPPKILFATTTELYSKIVSSAAKKCHMPFHVNRWLSGTVTAASSYVIDKKKWSFLINNSDEKLINSCFHNQFFKHKKNLDQQKNQVLKYQMGRKPTLLIIPDVSNNEMILKETNSFGIPAIGLVSSNTNTEIAYPIFANDLSFYSVHFFCHFLSSLILKEFVKIQHKIYTTKNIIKKLEFQQDIGNIFKLNAQILKKEWNIKPQPFENLQPYVFKGRYFLDKFFKPRLRLKKNEFFQSKVKQRIWKKKFTSKKLIFFENYKRGTKNQRNCYAKRETLWKIDQIQKRKDLNFTKIVRELYLYGNKPTFRFWKKSKFYFSKRLIFSSNTALTYQIENFKFRSILRKSLKKARHREWEQKKKLWKSQKNKSQKNKYKKNKYKNKNASPNLNLGFSSENSLKPYIKPWNNKNARPNLKLGSSSKNYVKPYIKRWNPQKLIRTNRK